MAWFILVRVLFVLAVTYAAVLTRPFSVNMTGTAVIGATLGVLIIWIESRLRSAEVTDLLGALIGGAIGLGLAKTIGAALFWADTGDRRIVFLHSFILLVFPYLGIVMKEAAPARLAAESVRYFIARGYLRRRTDEAMDYLTSLLPMAVGSVDRLEEIPDRLKFLFDYDPAAALARAEVAGVLHEHGAREVITVLAEAIQAPLVDRDAFRAMANRVKERTGMKGKALFHPIRVALTGEGAGPELDLAVPAIERGAAIPANAGMAAILSCRDRAVSFAAEISRR